MKPASIIALIIGAVLMLTGFIICAQGESKAEAAGLELFASARDENGDRVTVMEYDALTLDKISIDLKEGNVYVRQGESAKVEIYNLLEGGYIHGISGGMLRVNDTLGIMDIIKEGAVGISFDGLRNMLHDISFKKAEKKIIVYIPYGAALNAIQINALEGDVIFEELHDLNADIIATAENGNITVNKTSTSLRIQASAKNGSVTVNGSFANDVRLSAEKGNLAIVGASAFVNASAETADGDIKIELSENINRYAASFKAPGGIYLNGSSLGTDFSTQNTGSMKITATAENGRVEISD